jgi:hypothetical protein
MATSDSQETKTYTARCHCNATIFTVTIPPLETGATTVTQCNCSICTKSGYNLVYPLREDVKFIKGEDELKTYLFGKKIRPHRFCGNCGTSILIDFKNLEDPDRKKRLAVSVGGLLLLSANESWTRYDADNEDADQDL